MNKYAKFIPCIAWDKRGKAISNYLVKGSEILVTTHVQIRSYSEAGQQTAIGSMYF